MTLGIILSLLISFSPLHAWSLSVQDDWTAPTSPDRSTSLQSSTLFTVSWKPDLQLWSKTACSSCNVTSLDLWVTSDSNSDACYKIASDIDITTTTSYQWAINIPPAALSTATTLWTLRFTPHHSTPPFNHNQQLSSPAFVISSSSPLSNSTTTTPPPSNDTTSSPPTTFTPTPTTTPNATPPPDRNTKRQLWIAGVVVGPVIGIALGALFAWFMLRRRQHVQARDGESSTSNGQGMDYAYYNNMHEGKNCTGEVKHCYWQGEEAVGGGRGYVVAAPVEMSGTVTPPEPVELWGGNTP